MMRLRWFDLACWLVTCGTCGASSALAPASTLLVYNSASDQSIALAAHYGAARNIPAANRIAVTWSATESADTATSAQAAALDTAIRLAAVRAHCDVIVLCRNLPTRISGAGSLDSRIASDGRGQRTNPYFSRGLPFTHALYGCYLVTRLDGWSWADANALVDRASAAKPGGAVLLDRSPAKEASIGYGSYGFKLGTAAAALQAMGVPVALETTNAFVSGLNLGGYASWGSNDPRFSGQAFASLTFAPGAVACTAVSTSAYALRTKPSSGQSQIAQLISQGATGAEGAVSEPMLSGVADPSILFPRYMAGASLGEAVLASEAYVGWKNVIVGDPLCCPYAKGR